MCWQGSMSFNSLCTPSGSTQASCVWVSSLGSDSRDQNNMWTSRDIDHHQNKVSSHDKSPIATSQEVRCVMSGAGHSARVVFASLSNTTMANALVSHRVTLWCCWTQLALWAAVENQTWTNMNLRALYSDQGKAQSFCKLCYLFFFSSLFCLKVSTHTYRHIPHKDMREWERKTEWVSRRQWAEDGNKKKKLE